MPRVTKKAKYQKSSPGKTEITGQLLLQLEEAVAQGADTQAEMAAALGIGYETFLNWRYGKRKNGAQEALAIQDAIRQGLSRRRDVFLKKAEFALARLVDGYDVEEVTVEDGETPKGTFAKRKVVTKHYQPNVTAVLFALVNSGKGRWQSINVEREKPINPADTDMSIPGFDPTQIVAVPFAGVEDDPYAEDAE